MQETSASSNPQIGGQYVANSSQQCSKFKKFGGRRENVLSAKPSRIKGISPRDIENSEGRVRTYDPNSGRFMQQDPIGLAGGDTNLYRYVFNNPLIYSDPSGKIFGVDDIAAIAIAIASVGAVVGVASALATYESTGSLSAATQAFESGFISGALSAGAAVLTVTTGGSTLLAVGGATGVDLLFSFLTAPTSIPNGSEPTFVNGLTVQTQCP